MKKLILLSLVLIAGVTFGQRVITDTLQGNETVYFESMLDAKQISVVCTELGGTSDGALYLQGSTDGSNFVNLVSTDGLFNFFANDTLTIVDGATWLINVEQKAFSYYRVKGVGTASDTTLVTINWGKR